MKVKTLDRKRADYKPGIWDVYEALYEGGEKIEAMKGQFVRQRPGETDGWYAQRLAEFHYKNIVGPAIDEVIGSTLQAAVNLDPAKDESGKRAAVDEFYAEFEADPTGEGEKTLEGLVYDALGRACVVGEFWGLVCFEGNLPEYQAQTRAEQEEAGLLRAMIRELPAKTVINVTRDRYGLASVMLKTRSQKALGDPDDLVDEPEGEKPKDVIRWSYYTRTQLTEWEIEVDAGQSPDPDAHAQQVTAPEDHRLAGALDGRGMVPVVGIKLPKSLWAMDRIGSLSKNELSKRNGLHWYETLCCYPELYHAGDGSMQEEAEDKGTKAVRGAQGVFEIEKDSELGFVEPSGQSLAHLATRLEATERDIHKALQNMAAAQGPGAAKQVQSAASKLRDAVAKQILCEQYAKRARAFVLDVAYAVTWSRGESYEWDVSGADRFDLVDAATLAAGAMSVQGLSELRHSETFQKHYWTKTALALAWDADTETRDRIAEEFSNMTIQKPGEEEDFMPGGAKREAK